MPFTKPHEPCDCNQLFNCCHCSPLLTSAIPFPSPVVEMSFGGMIVSLPFLRGPVFVVSSFVYNLMPDFLLPSAHLSEIFLLDWSDLFSILSATLSGLKVSHPHPQLRFPSTAVCANSRITLTCFAGFLLPLSPPSRYESLTFAGCLLAFATVFKSWNCRPKISKTKQGTTTARHEQGTSDLSLCNKWHIWYFKLNTSWNSFSSR